MKICLYYLFSRNDKIGSKCISWGTFSLQKNNLGSICKSWKNTPSHVALLINKKWVFESTLSSGIRIISYKKWLEINQQVALYPCSSERTYEEIKTLYKCLEGKSYDYLGVIYFGWRILLNLLFKMPIPVKNRWASSSKYFCTEVIGKLLKLDYGMTSPVQLMEYLNEQTKKSS